ncbi:hypothetical protein, partial [Muribacter muris]|uniref:hypothetical protein n=1 Tax=Muribacter muris TaxID=67855 RepID=UPI001D1663C5
SRFRTDLGKLLIGVIGVMIGFPQAVGEGRQIAVVIITVMPLYTGEIRFRVDLVVRIIAILITFPFRVNYGGEF